MSRHAASNARQRPSAARASAGTEMPVDFVMRNAFPRDMTHDGKGTETCVPAKRLTDAASYRAFISDALR